MREDFWKRFPSIPGFDCIKMKREVQAEIYEEIKDMPQEEQIAYFNRAGRRFRKRFPQATQHDTLPMAKEEPGSYGRKTRPKR